METKVKLKNYLQEAGHIGMMPKSGRSCSLCCEMSWVEKQLPCFPSQICVVENYESTQLDPQLYISCFQEYYYYYIILQLLLLLNLRVPKISMESLNVLVQHNGLSCRCRLLVAVVAVVVNGEDGTNNNMSIKDNISSSSSSWSLNLGTNDHQDVQMRNLAFLEYLASLCGGGGGDGGNGDKQVTRGDAAVIRDTLLSPLLHRLGKKTSSVGIPKLEQSHRSSRVDQSYFGGARLGR